MYGQGDTVIVTEKINKTEERHEVGVVMKSFVHKKNIYHNVLLERRSAISFINTSKSSKRYYINRNLTEKLVDSGVIETTIPYKSLVDNEELPIIIA